MSRKMVVKLKNTHTMTPYQKFKTDLCQKHFGIDSINIGHENYFIFLRDMDAAPANYEPINEDDEERELDAIDRDCERYHARKDD
jgi:hypothetical protein